MEKTKGGWEKEREKNGEQVGHYSACTTYTCNWGNLDQPQISYIRKVKISFYNVARSPLPVCTFSVVLPHCEGLIIFHKRVIKDDNP